MGKTIQPNRQAIGIIENGCKTFSYTQNNGEHLNKLNLRHEEGIEQNYLKNLKMPAMILTDMNVGVVENYKKF